MQISSNTNMLSAYSSHTTHTVSRNDPKEGTKSDIVEDKIQQQKNMQNVQMKKASAQKTGIGGSLDLRA
jgi:IS5 family transposase